MANNLHVSYDLKNPGQNYDAVITGIKHLGRWAKLHYSFWYVSSALTAEQARNALLPTLDVNDSLYVVDATSNNAAWHNLPLEVERLIRANWLNRQAA